MNVKRNIKNFYELPAQWQQEARNNLDNPEEILYLEPAENDNPSEHVLWSLDEAIPTGTTTKDYYQAIIGISNNSALELWLDNNMEYAYVRMI